MIRLAGISSLKWSSNEQIWPFEKDDDGNTLYCKKISISYLNTGTTSMLHNIPGLTVDKIFKLYAHVKAVSYEPMPWVHAYNVIHNIQIVVTSVDINIYCNSGNYAIGYPAEAFLIYKK